MYQREHNYEKISKLLSIPANSVRFIVNNNYNRTKKKPEKKKILGTRDTNRIKCEVKIIKGCRSKVTARKLKENFDLNCSIRTIRRQLSSMNMKFKKKSKKILLKPQHKERRIELAEK